MPLDSLKLVPGINSVKTPSLLEVGWSAGSNIRFFQGLMQKDAGWVDLIDEPDLGPVLALLAWEALDTTKWLGIASGDTSQAGGVDQLHVWDGATLTDITPVASGATFVATLDHFGEFLLCVFQATPIFLWMPPPAPAGPAVSITAGGAPQLNNFMFVAAQQQMVVVCGTQDLASGNFDPMLIRWSDVSDYNQWTPTATDQAGSFRLSNGSAVRAAITVYGQNLIWTDTAIYSMQYIEFPLVWGFQPLGINCGADGPHAVGILAGVPFWKAQNQFFTLSNGAPHQIECPVWDQVFPGADPVFAQTTVCETDTFYGEVGWSVRQLDGSWIFARVNVATGAWTCAPYHHHRAWIDENVFGAPIGGHESGLIDQHDTGYNANTQAAPWSATTGIIPISEGSKATHVRDLIPDFKYDGTNATVLVTAYFYDYPNRAPRVKGPYTLTPTTTIVHPRGRGLGVQFKFEGNDLDSFVRIGNVRVRRQPDGGRP
jgi:hypothetical protein